MGFAREASPSSTGTQRVSLKDIADELGISQTAVSFAINDRLVFRGTKRRVKEAAAKLGWTPVYAAQALGSSKTMTIGFAPARSAQGLTDETFMLHFMAGVHTSLSPKGYGLLYRPCRSLNEEMSVYRDWASRKRVDGVILVDLRADDPRPKLLKELGVRAVLAGGLIRTIMYRRCPSMIRAPWAPCLNICRHWGTAVSPICPAIPISIIRRGVCRRFGRSQNGANWNPSTSSSRISMPSRLRCLRWRCCVRRSLLLHSSTRRKFLPRPVCMPWPKHIPPGN